MVSGDWLVLSRNIWCLVILSISTTFENDRKKKIMTEKTPEYFQTTEKNPKQEKTG